MDDFSLSDMFRDDDDKPAPAYREMSGLKLAGSHKKTITLGGRDVDVPTFRYVEVLEKQIRDLRTELRAAQKQILQLARLTQTNGRNGR